MTPEGPRPAPGAAHDPVRAAVRREAGGREAGGRTAGRRAPIARLLAAAAALAFAFVALRAIARPAPLLAGIPASRAVWDAQGRLLRLTLASDQQYRLITPLAQIAPALVEATLLHEDRWFRYHPGVNPVALARAGAAAAFGRRRAGASTITMQLARRLDRSSSRTLGGKLRQIARSLAIEALHSKDEILEAYLNLVPCGNNVEGFGAAALIDFGKPASRLLLPESLALAVVPQSPRARTPRDDNAALLAARRGLFARWVARHPEAAGDAPLLNLPLAVRGPAALPFLAPHYVDEVLAQHPGSASLVGTLDLGLQRLIERHVHTYVGRNAPSGIHNAAVLLVDHRDMAVRAWLGSADHGDASIAGQVNGVTAPRSPGSALKPFVYALGFAQGVIHPRSVLKDTPSAFAAFQPENFDGRFVGPINAHDALVRSRNIPALAIAARLARPSLHQFLAAAGVGRLQAESHYGLALVLGGVEVTMEELVGLYAMLANRGRLRPLRALATDPPLAAEDAVPLLSEEATYLTLDILGDNPRPDRFAEADRDRGPAVYWKTGTSFGFRDAWAAGIVGPYVLAVWIGDFAGHGNPAFVGLQAAAPLFFEIADSLRAQAPAGMGWRPRVPPRLRRVEVCAESGELPGPHCHQRKRTWFIPGRSPIGVCGVHREVLIDDATGLRACAGGDRPSHVEVLEVWPSDLLRLWALAGMPRREPPPPDPRCPGEGATRGSPPRITSPLRAVTYAVDPGSPERSQLTLAAVSDGETRDLYWFLDDGYLGRARRGHGLLVQPTPGVHRVRVVDDLGRADTRDLKVEVLAR